MATTTPPYLLAVAVLMLPPAAVGVQPPKYVELSLGLSYSHIEDDEVPLSIHVLRVDRHQAGWQWTTALAAGRVYGLDPLTKIVRTTSRDVGTPVLAAINGDWFEIAPGNYQGDPRGLHIIDGEVVSAPTPHTCLWIDSEGDFGMGTVESRFRVVWSDGETETAFGLNEYRADDRAVVFTPALGHHPSDTTPLANRRAPWTAASTVCDRLMAAMIQLGRHFELASRWRPESTKFRATGNSPLDADSIILSVGPKLADQLPRVSQGDRLMLRLETVPDLTGVWTAVGGGLRLMKAGQRESLGNVAPARHPRSMVGWNDENIFLVVVDGRQPELSVGMTYQELAELAVELNCAEAMALDGGGSSTLWADGRLLNSPSDGEPRSVANALILLKQEADLPSRRRQEVGWICPSAFNVAFTYTLSTDG